MTEVASHAGIRDVMGGRSRQIPTPIAIAVIAAATVGAVLATGYLANRGVAGARARRISHAGEVLPAFGAEALDGTPLTVGGGPARLGADAAPPKLLLVHFFVSYCGSCRMEIAQVKRAVETYGPDGFAAIGFSLDPEAGVTRQTIANDGVTWPIARLDGGYAHPFLAEVGVARLPYALLLDGEGRVVSENVLGTELPALIESALGTAN